MELRGWTLAAPLLLLTACGDDAPKVDPRAAEAKSLSPGQYEVTAKVSALRSTDKTTPATKLKVGDTATTTGCVGADGVPLPALIAEDAADSCKTTSSYVSSAILNVALTCTRKTNPGWVNYAVDGAFTAEAFTGKVTTTTSFAGSGDYRLVRELTARRTGVCVAAKS